MTATEQRPRVLAYLLRLWPVSIRAGRVAAIAEDTWRASLESARTRERWAFGTLDELCAFLREETSRLSEGERECEEGVCYGDTT
jgi:hypothetical protein